MVVVKEGGLVLDQEFIHIKVWWKRFQKNDHKNGILPNAGSLLLGFPLYKHSMLTIIDKKESS